jgi:hypothetical protein
MNLSSQATDQQIIALEGLAWISHHVWTLLVGCRKGGASAPPESWLPPSVGPVPRAACGCKLRGARDTGIIRKAL